MVIHVLKMGIMTSCPTPVCWGGGGGGGGGGAAGGQAV